MPDSTITRANKSERIDIRLTLKELGDVKEAARFAGLTVSAYGRRRILGHTVASQMEAEAIRELRQLAAVLKEIIPKQDATLGNEVAKTFEELRLAIRRLGAP